LTLALAAGTAFQLVGHFNGRPDAIDLRASTAGILVRLTDRLFREDSVIALPTGALVSTYISRETVEARDPSGAGTAVVDAIGKWAARDEPSESDDPEPAAREY
jgi:hypothetical protein